VTCLLEMSDLKVACALTIRIAQLERTLESNKVGVEEQLKQINKNHENMNQSFKELAQMVDKFEKKMREQFSTTDERLQEIINERKIAKVNKDRTTEHFKTRAEAFTRDLDGFKKKIKGRISKMNSSDGKNDL